MIAEDLYKYIERLPAIMTEKQYKDLVDSRTDEILHPDGEEIDFNVFNLLEQSLLFYMGLLQKEPHQKNFHLSRFKREKAGERASNRP